MPPRLEMATGPQRCVDCAHPEVAQLALFESAHTRKVLRLCGAHAFVAGYREPPPGVRVISDDDLFELQVLEETAERVSWQAAIVQARRDGYLLLAEPVLLVDRVKDHWRRQCSKEERVCCFVEVHEWSDSSAQRFARGYTVTWTPSSVVSPPGLMQSRTHADALYDRVRDTKPWKTGSVRMDGLGRSLTTPPIIKLEDAQAFAALVVEVETVIRDKDLYACSAVMDT